MAYSSPSPPLQPPPPPPPPPHPPPPPAFHDTTLTLALAPPPPHPQPLAWAVPSSPRPPHARRPRPADGFARVRASPPAGDTLAPCTECGKRFPSWKALFGHMRCHPERQWRGITPPPQHLRDLQFTVQEREVAASLLMLAGAGKANKKSLLGSPRRKEKDAGCAPASASTSKCDEDHKCGVCHKGFATGQALGGHKRCHWEAAVVAAASSSSNCSVLTTSQEAPAPALDLNVVPPGTPQPPRKNDQQDGGSSNAMLDLKLGY